MKSHQKYLRKCEDTYFILHIFEDSLEQRYFEMIAPFIECSILINNYAILTVNNNFEYNIEISHTFFELHYFFFIMNIQNAVIGYILCEKCIVLNMI